MPILFGSAILRSTTQSTERLMDLLPVVIAYACVTSSVTPEEITNSLAEGL